MIATKSPSAIWISCPWTLGRAPFVRHVGSWVNLGAGTSNSDLKNTYGTVKLDYDASGKVTLKEYRWVAAAENVPSGSVPIAPSAPE